MKSRAGFYTVCCVSLLLTTHNLKAAQIPPSLFLTTKEQHAPNQQDNTRTTLDALIYYSPTQWTIWLNGTAYTPDSPSSSIHIEQVSAETVTLTQTLGTQSARFTLAPQQSYDWSSKQILGRP